MPDRKHPITELETKKPKLKKLAKDTRDYLTIYDQPREIAEISEFEKLLNVIGFDKKVNE